MRRRGTFNLRDELLAVAAALDDAGIVYALCGGLAVAVYAEPRATQDIDLLVRPRSVARIIPVLARLGWEAQAAPMQFARMRIHRLIKMFAQHVTPLDLLLAEDVETQRILSRRVAFEVKGVRVWVVTRAGLIRLKARRGGDIDRYDIRKLKETR